MARLSESCCFATACEGRGGGLEVSASRVGGVVVEPVGGRAPGWLATVATCQLSDVREPAGTRLDRLLAALQYRVIVAID